MDAETIARVARGLSSSQRVCLAFWPRGHFTEATRKALAARGLIRGMDVTPDGLAVRQWLQENGG